MDPRRFFASSNFYLASKLHSLFIGTKMTISYLKKAKKTPQSGSDETRRIVADMLAKIEVGGEETALAYGRDLDGRRGHDRRQVQSPHRQLQS